MIKISLHKNFLIFIIEIYYFFNCRNTVNKVWIGIESEVKVNYRASNQFCAMFLFLHLNNILTNADKTNYD